MPLCWGSPEEARRRSRPQLADRANQHDANPDDSRHSRPLLQGVRRLKGSSLPLGDGSSDPAFGSGYPRNDSAETQFHAAGVSILGMWELSPCRRRP